jgi:hypothetical protein
LGHVSLTIKPALGDIPRAEVLQKPIVVLGNLHRRDV